MPKSSSFGQTRRRPVAREEDVLGLEIAVRDALGVRGVERLRDAAQDRQRLGERELADALDQRVERLAVEVLHHVVLAAVLERAEREDVDDVAVADLVDRARLGDEPRHHLGIDRELAASTLIATSLPISGWTALYTVPNPPCPSLPSISYSPTRSPGARSRSARWGISALGSDTGGCSCKRRPTRGVGQLHGDRSPSVAVNYVRIST